jgi:hypothetical protein
MIIDSHAHLVPPDLLAAIPKAKDRFPSRQARGKTVPADLMQTDQSAAPRTARGRVR